MDGHDEIGPENVSEGDILLFDPSGLDVHVTVHEVNQAITAQSQSVFQILCSYPELEGESMLWTIPAHARLHRRRVEA